MSEPAASPEEVAGLLKSRRTINFFSDQPVDQQLIAQAVDCARWAPNHRLTEPWRFALLGPQSRAAVIDLAVKIAHETKGPEAANKRRERLAAVPEWLAVTCRRSDNALMDQEDYAATCCAVQNLMLALWSSGVGCKWTTGAVTRHPDLWPLLELKPDEHRMVGLIWVGYPDRVPESRRSPVDESFLTLS
ncbi:MAG: nitroreductase [Pseudomonadota bacterium]